MIQAIAEFVVVRDLNVLLKDQYRVYPSSFPRIYELLQAFLSNWRLDQDWMDRIFWKSLYDSLDVKELQEYKDHSAKLLLSILYKLLGRF
jgi:hypothetical protein